MRIDLVDLSEMAEEKMEILWVLGGITTEKITLKSLIVKLLGKLDNRWLYHLNLSSLGVFICSHKQV